MLLFMIPILIPVKAATSPLPAPAFWVEPETESFQTATTSVGYMFNVTVHGATPATDAAGYRTFAWQVEIGFNPSQLNCVESGLYDGVTMYAPTFGHSELFAGLATIAPPPYIDNSTGYVKIGESLEGSESVGATTDVYLAWAEFEIMSAPAPGQTLSCNIDPGYGLTVSPIGTKYLDNQVPPAVASPAPSTDLCAYSYAWTPPPTPVMEIVNSTTRTFGMFTSWVGYQFTDSIVISGLSNAWYLTNATTTLNFNATLLNVVNVVFDPLWANNANVTDNVGGTLVLTVWNPTSTPSGNVIIADVTMQIMYQSMGPPIGTAPFGYYDQSVDYLTDTALNSSYATIGLMPFTLGPSEPVIIYAYQTAIPPFLSVQIPTLPASPALGESFTVSVNLNDVTEAADHLVGIQFYLVYDSTVLSVDSIQEGPWFPYWASLEPGSLGTFFFGQVESTIYGQAVLCGELIYPNSSGTWNEPLPNGSGTVLYITFEVITEQSYGEANITTALTFEDWKAVGLTDMITQTPHYLTMSLPVNGVVTIPWNWPGRDIDLYGGAVNDGASQTGYDQLVGPYYSTPGSGYVTGPVWQFPVPYGGQGPNAPMDLVLPQSLVYLWANVTYNYFPVSDKLVGIEIQEPSGAVYAKYTAYSDANGVAGVTFRMPWPEPDPESLFGIWTVTATVSIADQVVNDTMQFEYGYLVNIWKVTATGGIDNYQYAHEQTVTITVTYGSYAMQTYPALFVSQLVDNLSVTDGIATYSTTVGNATGVFNVYNNYTFSYTIYIPYWAYAGIATIYTNAFSYEPTEGGVAITPEYVGPEIAIQPY
jgi:hypothetical protein